MGRDVAHGCGVQPRPLQSRPPQHPPTGFKAVRLWLTRLLQSRLLQHRPTGFKAARVKAVRLWLTRPLETRPVVVNPPA
jgi:hypothetical protein